jgi:hypothetical protein
MKLTSGSILCVLFMVQGIVSCRGSDGDADGAGDVDGDSDGDSDADADTDADTDAGSRQFGESHEGQYHLGPVDFAETEWPNACTPAGGYRPELRDITGLGGEYLAGVSNSYAENGGVCDACILIDTAQGESIVARVVTYGVTSEPGNIDVSPSVYDSLNHGEYPRTMSWVFTNCPDTGALRYEFQTGANVWWTSFWVRNQKVPVTKVEVKSTNHAEFFELRRETDGTVNDDGGFGEGEFTLRITAMDGQVIEDTFPSFEPGELKVSTKQFE